MIDIDTGAVHSLAGQSLHISNGAAVSPDWKFVAIVPSDGRPGWVRDLETFEPMTQIPDCTFPKAFSPDSRFLVLSSSCDGAHARVIDWAGGDTVLDLGEAYLNEAAFSPGGAAEEGRYLVAVLGGPPGTEEVVMYDMATGEQVMGSVFPLTISLAFDPSGRYLAGGEIDGSAWVLDLAALLDGETPEDALIFDATTHSELVWRVRMNADGVLATTSDRSIRLWDAFDGRMIAEPYVSAILPPVSVFGPEGDYLLYADHGSVLRPFYFDTDDLLELAAHGSQGTSPPRNASVISEKPAARSSRSSMSRTRRCDLQRIPINVPRASASTCGIQQGAHTHAIQHRFPVDDGLHRRRAALGRLSGTVERKRQRGSSHHR